MSEELQTNRLQQITAEIITLTQQGQKVALSYAIEIGRRLTAAKGLVNHGEWAGYLKETVHYSERTAQNFMKLFSAYGADQTDLFGTPKAKTFADLSYSQALALLAVPEEEREELAAEAKTMSTREFQEAIREREEARKALEDTKAEMRAQCEKLNEALEREKDAAKEAVSRERERADKLKKALAAAEARPVEVAVQNATEEQLEEVRAQEREAAEIREERLKKETAEIRAELEKAKAESTNREEVEELRKRILLADPATVEFRLHFTTAQEEIAKAEACIGKAAPEVQDKLRAALAALGKKIGGNAEC